MIQIGQTQALEIKSLTPQGAYLGPIQDSKFRTIEVLLPKKELPPNSSKGDTLEVFVYKDSEDRPIATTQKPLAQAGDFAALKVLDRNRMGAFLDWGLPKDLLLPFKEQRATLHVGKKAVVYVYLDEISNRVIATGSYQKHLSSELANYATEERVELLIAERTPMGYKAIINQTHQGLLLHSNIITPVDIGDTLTGYVQKVHPDGKIDLLQQPTGEARTELKREDLLLLLKAKGGNLPLHDKSSPEAIKSHLGVSKKTFKKLIGALYKENLIVITEDGIQLI